jgi:hypothetical protein
MTRSWPQLPDTNKRDRPVLKAHHAGTLSLIQGRGCQPVGAETQSRTLTCGLASVAEVREDPRHGVQTPLLDLLSAHRLARAAGPPAGIQEHRDPPVTARGHGLAPTGRMGCANSDVSCELGSGTQGWFGGASAPTAEDTWCCRTSPTSRCAAPSSCSPCSPAGRRRGPGDPPPGPPTHRAPPPSPTSQAPTRRPRPARPRSAACYPDPVGRASWSSPRRCWAGIGGWSPARGPTRTATPAGRR